MVRKTLDFKSLFLSTVINFFGFSRSKFEAMLFALCKNEESGMASMRFFLDVS